MTHGRTAWARLSTSKRATLGLVILGTLAMSGTFAEIVASDAPIVVLGPHGLEVLPALTTPADAGASADRYEGRPAIWPLVRSGPTLPTAAGPNAPPSLAHPLGTDARSRDLVARLVYGARTALGLSLFAIAVSTVLGALLGGLAGFYRGAWDARLVRLVETVDTFPAIIVVALVRAIEQKPSALSLVVAVAFVRWAEVARLVRAEVLRASAEDYVTAARGLGASPARILLRHMAPNAAGPVLVSSVFGVASVVLLEAAISFLGMSGQTDAASWGETLAEGARDPSQVGLVLLPGLALLLTVGASYLLADAVRDAIDPRAVRRRADAPEASSPLGIARDPMG